MKSPSVLLALSLFSTFILSAQTSDPKVSIGGISEGSISKEELLKQEKLVPGSNDIIIVSFTMSYTLGEDDFVELTGNSDKLTREMKDHISKLKPGTELSFENIKAKRGDKILILESIVLKVKE